MNREERPDTERIRMDQIDAYARLATAPPDDKLLRRYFDLRAGRPTSPELTDAEQRWIATNLEESSAWQERWRALEAAEGYPLARQPAQSPRSAPGPAADRAPRRSVPGRPAALTVLVVGSLYGVLWLGGRMVLPETYSWASVEAHEPILDRQTRSSGTEAQDAFAEAARALLAAPQSTLGLFPRYDGAHVEEAVRHLHTAYDATLDPFQRAEIAFFLAKAYLMQEDIVRARSWLEQVQAQQVPDYQAETARLLRALRPGDAR